MPDIGASRADDTPPAFRNRQFAPRSAGSTGLGRLEDGAGIRALANDRPLISKHHPSATLLWLLVRGLCLARSC